MPINKKKFHDVEDSWVDREDGKGGYYNVQARFSDHPVINPGKSQIARHNVYDFAIVLHTRVKRTMGDAKAQENLTAQTIRFDKGKRLGSDDFEKAKALIVRCWDAWEYYQQYREAPVTESEQTALHQIELQRAHSLAPGKVLVDVGGVMVERDLDPDSEDRDEEEDEEPVRRPAKAAPAAKPKKAPAKRSKAA